ncbi:MAG: extracellular solute-binding protein [Propionibacteriaceae bacterium]|nr:extracellular solute-binding protein [Propionibacteriaceae bacterium]
MRSLQHRALGIAALVVSGALVMAGCSSSTPGGDTSTPGTDTTTSTAPAVVTIYGTPTGDEQTQWENSWKGWAAANNITIQYTGDRDFGTNIATKIQGNSLPDIAVFPQPGLMQAAFATGKAIPLDATTLAAVQQNFTASWQSFGTYQNQQYAVPLDASAKGYIWYQPSQFTTWGVSVPTSWDELMTLTATIQSKTGNPPWCVGFGSGGSADGWPGTDQIAEYVLSADGTDFYNQWVAGTVPFTDPKIKDAFTALGDIWTNQKYVNAGFGGTSSIATTQFGDVAAPLANGTCAMTNQATFLESSFNSVKTAAGGTPVVGSDGDVWAFMMPPVAGTPSVMGGGDFAVAFADRPEVQKVMAYLASGEYANSLITVENATFLTANQGVDPANEKDPLLQEAIKTLADPTANFAFGAGDTMPSVVQTAWWKGMIDWMNGAKLDTVLGQIQAAWANA